MSRYLDTYVVKLNAAVTTDYVLYILKVLLLESTTTTLLLFFRGSKNVSLFWKTGTSNGVESKLIKIHIMYLHTTLPWIMPIDFP